ncbi:AAA family ATPase [Bacillus sonorensis]|uniref:ATP-binding protein n=1 Tax=Bacillus sonorensis TaxID=119858 RepID=UPI00228189D1|nr:AAA family ATPase [Bacillus sonorensis]
MNIHTLHIYGYGKFTNQTFRLSSSNLHLIYGLNESGKTTLMSFIESMLFGFPKTKRYEPKAGGIYGGMLEAVHPAIGHIRIERTAGRPEKVNVFLEDGSTRSEDFLKQMLSNMDRRLYKAIYSFDVFGLQEIHKFNRDKIGRFLLFSSLFGSDAISKMDASLAKTQEELFKPNGRKPELNRELENVKRLSEELKKAKAREDDYHQILNGKRAAEAKVDEHEQLIKDLARSIAEIEQAIEIHPLVKEERQLAARLEADGEAGDRFPEAGLFELEKYESHLHPKEAQLKALEEKKRDLEKQSAAFSPSKEHLQHEAQIEEMLAEYPFYQSHKEKVTALTEQLKQTNKRVQAGMTRLQIESEDEILSADTTYEYEWKLQETVRAYLQLREQKRALDERFEQARADLEEAEQAYLDLSKEVLPEDIRKQKEEAAARLESAGAKAEKREELIRQLSLLKKENKQREKRSKRAAVMTVLTALAVCLAALFFKQWLLSVFIALASLLYLFSSLKKTESSPVATFIQKQLEDIGGTASEHAPDLKNLREELWRDDQNRQFLIAKQGELRQKEADYERAIQQFEEWEKDMFPYQEQADRYMKELKLSIDPSFLPDAFALMKELKADITKKRELEEELARLQEKRESFDKRVLRLASLLSHPEGSVQDLVFRLKEELDVQKELLRQKQEVDLSLKHTLEQIKELSGEAEYFTSRLADLYKRAGATGRDMFLKLAKRDQERKELKARLGHIQAELGRKDAKVIRLASNHPLADLEDKLAKAKDQKAHTEKQLKEERENVAFLLAEQRRLEESGTVSELTHQVEIQKERVAELAKKWASVKLIRQAVKNRMDDHKKIRLPKLLETAESLLKPLTGDRYEKIYFSETDDSMMVVSKDGTVFQAHELSQATCEQLYLAIRFALALSHQKDINLPFQLDDSFVHFDHERFKRVLNILKELSGQEQQILYFTCHEHVKEAFRDEEVIQLPPDMNRMVKKVLTSN